MSIDNWIALITAISALIGAAAAAFWGLQHAHAKDATIAAKDAELTSLKSAHAEFLKAKEVEFTTLHAAQQETLHAKDALLNVHLAEIARLQDWSPTSIQERYLALAKVLEHQIAEKDRQIAALQITTDPTNTQPADLLQAEREAYQKRLDLVTAQLEEARQTEITLRDQLQSLQKQIIPSNAPATTKAQPERGLTPDLLRRLSDVLARHPAFANDRSLMVVFTDARIAPWRDNLPHSQNLTERTRYVISCLHDHYTTAGDNALALFLYVLADNIDPADPLQAELRTLSDAIDLALTQRPAA